MQGDPPRPATRAFLRTPPPAQAGHLPTPALPQAPQAPKACSLGGPLTALLSPALTPGPAPSPRLQGTQPTPEDRSQPQLHPGPVTSDRPALSHPRDGPAAWPAGGSAGALRALPHGKSPGLSARAARPNPGLAGARELSGRGSGTRGQAPVWSPGKRTHPPRKQRPPHPGPTTSLPTDLCEPTAVSKYDAELKGTTDRQ